MRQQPPDRDRRTQGETPTEMPFEAPTRVERVFNRIFGLLVGLGIGLGHNYLVEVRGRKSGRLYSTPVDVLFLHDKLYLVAARGYTQWVRNALADGRVTLRKGRVREDFRIVVVGKSEKPEILMAYLNRFRLTVQRYFPIPAGSPASEFEALAARYPVLHLTPAEP